LGAGWPAGPHYVVAAGLEEMARVAVALQQAALATRLCGAAAAWRHTMGTPLQPYRRASSERTLQDARAALGDCDFAAAWAAGEALRTCSGSPELRLIQQRHAQVFLALAEAAEEPLRGPDQAARRTRVEQELANLRAAVQWSLAAGELEPALRAAAALWMFWFVRGYATEGRQWLDALLAQPKAATAAAARAKALFTAGMLAFYQGDHAAGRALHQEGLALQRQLGDRAGIASALFGLGWDRLRCG